MPPYFLNTLRELWPFLAMLAMLFSKFSHDIEGICFYGFILIAFSIQNLGEKE